MNIGQYLTANDIWFAIGALLVGIRTIKLWKQQHEQEPVRIPVRTSRYESRRVRRSR